MKFMAFTPNFNNVEELCNRFQWQSTIYPGESIMSNIDGIKGNSLKISNSEPLSAQSLKFFAVE